MLGYLSLHGHYYYFFFNLICTEVFANFLYFNN